MGGSSGEATASPLPAPSAAPLPPPPPPQVDIIRLQPRGELLMAMNSHGSAETQDKASKERNAMELYKKGCRKCQTNLVLALSRDQGRSWNR